METFLIADFAPIKAGIFTFLRCMNGMSREAQVHVLAGVRVRFPGAIRLYTRGIGQTEELRDCCMARQKLPRSSNSTSSIFQWLNGYTHERVKALSSRGAAEGAESQAEGRSTRSPRLRVRQRWKLLKLKSSNQPYSCFPASGKKSGCPNWSLPNSPMIFWVAGAIINSTKAFAPSAFTFANFSGLTCIT